MGSNTRETIPDGSSQHLSTSFGSALMASRRLHRVLLNFSSSKCLWRYGLMWTSWFLPNEIPPVATVNQMCLWKYFSPYLCRSLHKFIFCTQNRILVATPGALVAAVPSVTPLQCAYFINDLSQDHIGCGSVTGGSNVFLEWIKIWHI